MAESRIVVYGAIAGNLGIAMTKFIVAGITGSSAMLSEGIHSTVDTADGLLLLVGLKRSQRKADPAHPFGYGKELYFWSLIVAVLIFGVGGGISAYEGVIHMMHPEPVQDPKWNYIVLGCATVFEGASFAIALHAFLKEKGETPFWRALRTSKDPSTFTVMAEDSAALMGLAIAALGIYLSHSLHLPVLDGAASVLIGVLLAGVATVLIYESRGLLIGEGMDREKASTIRELVASEPEVVTAAAPLSMYFGPDNILLNLDVQFRHDISGSEIAAAVERIEQKIRTHSPEVKRIFIEARHVVAAAQASAASPSFDGAVR